MLLDLASGGGSAFGAKLGAYARLAKITDTTVFESFGRTAVINPRQYPAAALAERDADDGVECRCPYPLLVPENPNAETVMQVQLLCASFSL